MTDRPSTPPLPKLAHTPPPRRILSVWCSQLALDRWRLVEGCQRGEGPDAAPLALIAETAHGPLIEAVNAAGREAGVHAGTRLADARTLCPQLAVAPSDPAEDHAFLEALALWARRWGPWSALDPPDGLLVDVTGVAHLFGGEAALLADVRAGFAARRIAVHLAIAPTAGAAWGLAHCPLPNGEKEEADPLARLPVAALRLDPAVLTVLRRLGLKRIGDLDRVGRDALQRRFRNRKDPAANPLLRLDQLRGLVAEPLLPVVPEILPLVQRRLLEPIRHRELLERVLADLADDLVRELEAQGKGARRLELGLWRVDGAVTIRSLECAAATRDPAHICRLFSEKLGEIDAGFGIETVRLRTSWAEQLAPGQGDMTAPEERPGTTLAAFIDRLATRLGPRAVTRPVPHASHIPERAQRWQPPLEPAPPRQEELRFHARPLKLLDKAERIAVLYATPDGYPKAFRWRGAVHEVARVEGPERIAPEWWRERSSARLRDYYRIEDGEGRRYWIYRHGIIGDGRGSDLQGGLPDWYLQGIFA